MVDVLSAHLQDAYSKWGGRSEQRADTQRLSYVGLRRYGHQDYQRKRILAREASREVREIT
jgi:hypothetical protein